MIDVKMVRCLKFKLHISLRRKLVNVALPFIREIALVLMPECNVFKLTSRIGA